jgi:hypothetical protein
MAEAITSVDAPRRVNGLAVAGFILSTSFFFSGIGVILSAVSLEQFRGYKGNDFVGKKLAFAGLIVGIMMSFLCFCYYIFILLNIPTWSGSINRLLYQLL